MGRPSQYSEEITDKICLEIATSDKGLEAICSENGFPTAKTIYEWLVRFDSFREKYARARESQMQLLADQLIAIADTTQEGQKITRKDGKTETVTGDMIEHRRLQVDTRKWILSKLAPKKYGDKQELNVTGELALAERISKARKRES